MKVIDNLWSVAEDLMKHPKHVNINYDRCEHFAEESKEDILKVVNSKPWGVPKSLTNTDDHTRIYYELLASAVNYCYWYGKPEIRPGDAGSTKMYSLLDESLFGVDKNIIDLNKFKSLLSENRFPLCGQRFDHVSEIYNNGALFIYDLAMAERKENMGTWFHRLINNLPGFNNDVFLKRAILFFTMLYRRYDWFKDEISLLPIPADYQIPKMLRYLDCIRYGLELSNKVDHGELILSGSLMECEIRAAALIACREIAKNIESSKMCDIDTYLFTIRKSCSDNFHLTITTDY